MDKVNLIKREAEKFVALSKKNKQELQDIEIEKKELGLIKNDLTKQFSDLEANNKELIKRQDEIRYEIEDNKELKKQNTEELKTIKENNKKIEAERKQIDQDKRDIKAEKDKLKIERLNIENLKSVSKATKELIIKQEKLKEQLGSLEENREQLKEDILAFKNDVSKKKQKLKDIEHLLNLSIKEVSQKGIMIARQKILQDKESKKLLDRENAIEAKLNILKDKDADIASRELDLGNFIKRLKKEHGLKKLKKEGLL